MEHEVFVPVPVASLRSALGDPARVARCVPSLQQDAGASEALAGRLKFRVDGHTITYRGALELTATDQDTVSVTGKGAAARGAGSVELALTITLEGVGAGADAGPGTDADAESGTGTDAEGGTGTESGTTIRYTGTATGDGRLVELDAEAVRTAARRLLDRFTQQLVTESLAHHDEPYGEQHDGQHGEQYDGQHGPRQDEPPASAAGAEARSGGGGAGGGGGGADVGPGAGSGPGTGSVFDAPVPPPSLDPVADIEFTVPDEPPAEAAHARRTMIGRSAEEVDHAPPRGRYAPVPSPESTTASSTLRWVAPAAALAIASAVVVGRALRRRR